MSRDSRPIALLALCAATVFALAASPAGAAKSGRAPKPDSGTTVGKPVTPTTTSSSSGPSTPSDGAVPGDLLLKLDRYDRLSSLMLRYRLTMRSTMGPRPIYRMRVADGDDVKQVAGALALEPGVLVAEPNHLHAGPEAAKNNVWAVGTASDFVQQWAPGAMRLPQAWTVSSGLGQRVAVLDSGVDRTHPLLAGRLLPGRDFVDRDDDPSEGGDPSQPSWGHGTHVAGLVALAAPGARIMPLRVLDVEGKADAWTLAEAMLYAVDPDGNPDTDDGAHIINLSLAGSSRTRLLDAVALLASCSAATVTDPAVDFSDAGYNDDERRCHRMGGALVVAAAGNDGSRSAQAYPAAEGGYGVWSGTSMATPLVSGAAALLRAAAPELTATDLVRCIERSAAPLAGASFGTVDAMALLQSVGSRKLCR